MEMNVAQWIQVIVGICTLVGIVVLTYRTFKDPEEKNEQSLAVLKSNCVLRHQTIDADIHDIKVNHLAHIERDIIEMKENQVKIFTILDERLPRKVKD